MHLRVGHQHSHIWPNRVRFVHYYSAFWGPRGISTIDEPPGAFVRLSSTLTICPILACFMDYYSPFWGPEAISIVVEPQDVLTFRSTISVLADFGPLRGLLLTVLGVLE